MSAFRFNAVTRLHYSPPDCAAAAVTLIDGPSFNAVTRLHYSPLTDVANLAMRQPLGFNAVTRLHYSPRQRSGGKQVSWVAFQCGDPPSLLPTTLTRSCRHSSGETFQCGDPPSLLPTHRPCGGIGFPYPTFQCGDPPSLLPTGAPDACRKGTARNV